MTKIVAGAETVDRIGAARVRERGMIIRGGENVYPREIEEFLYGHPKVLDVQVFGVPMRSSVSRCVRGCVCASMAARVWRRSRITVGTIWRTTKVPHHVRFVDAFPMTVTGKVQKYRMHNAMVDELGLGAASSD